MFALANPSQVALGRSGRGRFVAALLGAAALVGGVSQGTAFAQIDDAQRVASRMAAGSPGWQQGLRDYLDKAGGDSGAVVDRARDIFRAYNQSCSAAGMGCTGTAAREAAQVAASSACSAQVMPVAFSDSYIPRRGTLGYDFQSVGASPARGFRPVVAGDPRLDGGDSLMSDGGKSNLADDGLGNVKRFRFETPENGDYRLILLGAKGAGVNANPFGKQIVVNGRAIDVTSGSGFGGAVIGKGSDRVRGGKIVEVPMLVVDTTVNSRELDVQFLNGAALSGFLLEPQTGISALGLNMASYNNTNPEQCSAAEDQIQQAANDGVPSWRPDPPTILIVPPPPMRVISAN
jgi:hypothetical protein